MGDNVLLTAAVRDLHRCHPGRFLTDIRTSAPAVWQHNPYLTPLGEEERGVEVVDCHCPLINRANRVRRHALHGFMEHLQRQLRVEWPLTEWKGDIHLSEEEKAGPALVARWTGEDVPFWLVAGGGKYDLTIKWWESGRYQEVIDHFRGRLQFVQVGHAAHWHPRLEGVIDLRGRTDLRQLILLMYHARGVVCPVTSLMHLAAAVETPPPSGSTRPCVVIAGGREPPQWEAYPGHRYLHTLGVLPCCRDGGCWKSRTFPLGDGDARDGLEHLCVNRVRRLPRCMHLIAPEEVIRQVEGCVQRGAGAYLDPESAEAGRRAVGRLPPNRVDLQPLHRSNAMLEADRFIETIPAYPGRAQGRGVVICGGGLKYFPSAWVTIHMLRWLGCDLPIELWHEGEEELDETMRELVSPLGVRCVDAAQVRQRYAMRCWGGWRLKPYALLHSEFQEVLLLDADNVPVRNPEALFQTESYRRRGAIFWPDRGRLRPDHPIWGFCGVPYRDEPEFESGQIVVDKARCWKPLVLALWYNEQSDFFYRWIHGDKDTFHLAFRRLRHPYAMPDWPLRELRFSMCQHDFDGRRLFQHRDRDKWRLSPPNARVPGFWFEDRCRRYLQQLASRWDGRVGWVRKRYPGSPLAVARRSFPQGVSLAACMISCPERARVRGLTLADLVQADWGRGPVHVQVDPGHDADRVVSMARNYELALQRGLGLGADYILILEDDLQCNRHLLWNLGAWKPLMEGEVSLASLYNPGVIPLAHEHRRRLMIARPESVYGTQAFLISRELARQLTDRWGSSDLPADHRLASLAHEAGHPICYHVPSLFQHRREPSTWGGRSHRAQDFDRDWKA